MKLIWGSGISRDFPLGARLVGLQKNGRRPVQIAFTREELLFLTDDTKIYYIQHLAHALGITKEVAGK